MCDYHKNGYCLYKRFFNADDIRSVKSVLESFHSSWKQKNAEFYAEKAINSAYLTGTEYLDEQKRQILFEFLGASKLMGAVSLVMKQRPTFLNTLLFFNPVNEKQRNYWHRDTQYHLSLEEQKKALLGPEVIHFRVALVDEPGIELVPCSHKRWDTPEELDVRLETNNRKSYEALSSGKVIELQAGDLLIFSANMIHRGLYGMDRFALDVLFCDPEPDLVKFISDECLPDKNIIPSLENADAFQSAIELKSTT